MQEVTQYTCSRISNLRSKGRNKTLCICCFFPTLYRLVFHYSYSIQRGFPTPNPGLLQHFAIRSMSCKNMILFFFFYKSSFIMTTLLGCILYYKPYTQIGQSKLFFTFSKCYPFSIQNIFNRDGVTIRTYDAFGSLIYCPDSSICLALQYKITSDLYKTLLLKFPLVFIPKYSLAFIFGILPLLSIISPCNPF